MSEILSSRNIKSAGHTNNNMIQWRVSVSGPFLISRCSEVLPGFINIIEEDLDQEPLLEFGNKFVKNTNISLVTEGTFEFLIDTHPSPVIHSAGEMMSEIRYKQEHIMKARDLSNGFVCLTPLQKDFWERKLLVTTPNINTTLVTNNSPEQYLFIARGYMRDQFGTEYIGNSIYRLDKELELIFSSNTTCHSIYIWK